MNGPKQWDDHKKGKTHIKNVKNGGPSKVNAKAISKQPPEEAVRESPEAEEAKTKPAAMEDVNQQYGYPGGWLPSQYGYPGGWPPPPYGYPGWPPPMGWELGYGHPVPPPPGCGYLDPPSSVSSPSVQVYLQARQ